MKNKILKLIIIAILTIMLVALTGCTNQNNVYAKNKIIEIVVETEKEGQERFREICSQSVNDGYITILYDKETKVQYVCIYSSYKNIYSSLNVLVDADGKPLLYEE